MEETADRQSNVYSVLHQCPTSCCPGDTALEGGLRSDALRKRSVLDAAPVACASYLADGNALSGNLWFRASSVGNTRHSAVLDRTGRALFRDSEYRIANRPAD